MPWTGIPEKAAGRRKDALAAEQKERELTMFEHMTETEAKEFYLKGNDKVEYVDSKYTALVDADALVLVTEWKEFRIPDFDEIKKRLKAPVIFDGRNQYDSRKMKEMGFEYYQIGAGGSSV